MTRVVSFGLIGSSSLAASFDERSTKQTPADVDGGDEDGKEKDACSCLPATSFELSACASGVAS